jgi:hypothetical protein
MKQFRIFAVISDLHIGNTRISAKKMKDMLKEQFIEPIKKMKQLDAIIVAGDVSHTGLYLSSDYADLYLWFFRRIYSIAEKRKATVVVLEGTYSHDMDHLSNIDYMVDNEDGVDFRIYRQFTSDYLFKDFKILALPDKRVTAKSKKYLENLLEDEYDMIIGHGMIDKMEFPHQESENFNTNAYVYRVNELMAISRGPIFFGHIHTHTVINEKFHYVGSFTKLERGNGTHGFLVCGINTKDSSQFKCEQYVNKESMNYHHIKIEGEDLITYDIYDIIKNLQVYLKSVPDRDLVTIRIKYESNGTLVDKVSLIDETFKRDERVSVVKKLINRNLDDREQRLKVKKEKFSYLFDKNLKLEDIIVMYYENEIKPKNQRYKNIILTSEMVEEIINDF